MSYVIKLRFLQICSLGKMLFSSGLQQLSKDYSKQSRPKQSFKSKKSAGITVAGNLVTDMGSASRFEL